MTYIRDAQTAVEVAAVADLIARSFNDLGPNRYLIPDPADRLPVMRDYFRLLTAHAYRTGVGRVMIIDDLSAAAVWFRRTVTAVEPADYDNRLAVLAGTHRPRFRELDLLLEAHHPARPHWHLAFLAVEPDQQHTGRGGTLLRHTLGWLDRHRTSAYLEATNPDNQRFYKRHGFTDYGPPIRLADNTPFYPMWRASESAHPEPRPFARQQ